MTQLQPMRAEDFAAFLQSAASAYAEDNIKSGRWLAEGAHERALADLHHYLPQGVDTPDHYLFTITATDADIPVGHIWYAIQNQFGQRSAFVYDIEIKPQYRRQGHASAALEAVQAHAAELGIKTMGLHVFAFNEGAIALYKKMGYQVTGVNMQKPLDSQSS